MRRGMALLFREARIVTEPAGAAAFAAAMGPYRARLSGRRFALIVCGGNIAIDGFVREIGMANA
jgi:threonine dehydratase